MLWQSKWKRKRLWFHHCAFGVCVLCLVLSPSWLTWLGPPVPRLGCLGAWRLWRCLPSFPCHPGLWASPPRSRRSSPGPRAQGISFCPPFPRSQVGGLRLEELHLLGNSEKPRLPEPPSLGASTHLRLGCGSPGFWCLSSSAPHVGGRRQNLTDLPWMECGTQGALLHAAAAAAAESRFPHRDGDGDGMAPHRAAVCVSVREHRGCCGCR